VTAPGVSADVAPGAHVEWQPVPPPYGPREQSAAGRRAAAAALAAAGSADRTVPRAPGGRPCFPRGFPGSIAHTDRLAVAVVVPGSAAVGVDIESAVVSPRMARFVLREEERRTLLPPAGQYSPRELFCAKEAAFKALDGTGAGIGRLFWRIELVHRRGRLVASHGAAPVPVWVRSEEGLSFAMAVRW
jgi:4'-phosphopantetheinyl transferase EntD